MLEFDHVGLTTETQPEENWIEQSRCWVTNSRKHSEHIEFLRYARGHDMARTRPIGQNSTANAAARCARSSLISRRAR